MEITPTEREEGKEEGKEKKEKRGKEGGIEREE